MKLWIDDLRPAPNGTYYWAKSVNDAKAVILYAERFSSQPAIELIDIDHDAGDFAQYGGDFIEVLNWLEKTGRNYPIRLHTMNVVGRMNMRAIIQHNGWKEVR